MCKPILAIFILAAAFAFAQAPPAAGRGVGGGGRGGGARGGAVAPAADETPCRGGAGPCDKQLVDEAAATRGRSLYAAECVNCHGALARGTDDGANLTRSLLVLRDRVGSELGPYFKKGHKTQSGVSTATFTQAQTADLSHFLKQRVNDGLRQSPLFRPQNVLVGDAAAGEAYFKGAGGCAGCHSPTGDLTGIGTRMTPVQLQQRFMFPGGGGRGGRGGPAPTPASPRATVTVTVTPPGKPAITGTPVLFDDFDVILRDPAGVQHAWKRSPELKVVKNDPFKAHQELLDKITDKNMHDVTAYLEKLK